MTGRTPTTRTEPTAPTSDPPTALARCVGDADQFLAHRFTVEPHAWSGSGFDDLLSLADVDRALTGAGLRRPAVRVVRDGDLIDPWTWTRPTRTGSMRIDDHVHPGRVLALFAEGATVVLQSLQRWWPPLTRFCRSLELELGHPVQTNAYLTPPGAAGLSPHHDTHDVFVLQVHGRKQWFVREPLIEAPLVRHRSDHDRAAAQPVLFEAELRPGDCLYLPRGYIHSATTQAGASLHLTVGVLARTVHDVLRRLVERAAGEPVFRQSLPPGYVTSPDIAARAVKEAVAEFMRWLERQDTAEVAGELRDRFWTSRPPALGGQLLELVSLDAIDDNTVIVRRDGISCELETADARLRITLGDRRLDLPEVLGDAVYRLVDGAPHEVRDLDDLLDGSSRMVLVRRLVREGLLRTSGDPAARRD
ncbi:MAG: cupin domain-containing protein [Acidimicrobiales bacterium]